MKNWTPAYLWAYLTVVILVIAWCITGIIGWPSNDTADITTSAICLPINLLWLVIAIRNIRRERADRAALARVMGRG